MVNTEMSAALKPNMFGFKTNKTLLESTEYMRSFASLTES